MLCVTSPLPRRIPHACVSANVVPVSPVHRCFRGKPVRHTRVPEPTVAAACRPDALKAWKIRPFRVPEAPSPLVGRRSTRCASLNTEPCAHGSHYLLSGQIPTHPLLILVRSVSWPSKTSHASATWHIVAASDFNLRGRLTACDGQQHASLGAFSV